MKPILSAVLSMLCVVVFVGVSSAGMMDTLQGKADEAKADQAKEASSDAHSGMAMPGAKTGQAIDAQSATKEEAGSMMDQVKEGAKQQTNEAIDGIGK